MKKILAVIGVIVLCVGAFLGGYFLRSYQDPDMASLKFVLEHYKKYYLEEDEDYIQIMANSILDKYSKYYTAEEYETIKKASQGIRAGIGLSFAISGEETWIYSVLGNSPAEHAGIKNGGKIVGIKAAGDQDFATVNYTQLDQKLSEIPVGEEFDLKILYQTEQIYTLTKREYNETYVYYTDDSGSYRYVDGDDGKLQLSAYQNDLGVTIPSDTAYIKFTAFNGLSNDLTGSAKQFDKVMEKFKLGGKRKLIIDLRGNGGGYLSVMRDIASHLIGTQGNNLCLSKAIYKDGSIETVNLGVNKYSDYKYTKIVFLADQNTASASEALIGACLDYDYFGVVKVVLSRSGSNGNFVYKTYGKGIMQTTIICADLAVGGAIKLTTAKIYWPVSNLSIHGVGITKDLAEYGDKIIEAPYVENVDYELIAALSA